MTTARNSRNQSDLLRRFTPPFPSPSASTRPPPRPLSFAPETTPREPPGCSYASTKHRHGRRRKSPFPVDFVDPEPSPFSISSYFYRAHPPDKVPYFFCAPDRAIRAQPKATARWSFSGEQLEEDLCTPEPATSPPQPPRPPLHRGMIRLSPVPVG